MIANLPGVNDMDFVERNPPRLTGRSIIRMYGPFALQSLISLVLAVLVVAGSFGSAVYRRLPELKRRITELEAKMAELQERLAAAGDRSR